MNAFTLVAINTGSASKTVTLSGSGLPADFQAFRTSSKEDAVELGTVAANAITLPASSITTFVNGSYREDAGATGTGGASGAGGATGAGGTTNPPRTGGASGTGGRASTGGAVGGGGTSSVATTTGTPGTGGVLGTGGAMAGTGGAAASGGAPGLGGATGVGGGTAATEGKAGGGCGCKLGGPSSASSSLWALALAGLAMVTSRLRRRRTPQDKATTTEDRCPGFSNDCLPSAILRDIEAMRIWEKNDAGALAQKVAPTNHRQAARR
jgi:MYXO-CTERM domain-containing protein